MSDKSPCTPALFGPLQPHSLLPLNIQRSLHAAASIEPETPLGESNFRITCLQLAIDNARLRHPRAFKPQ